MRFGHATTDTANRPAVPQTNAAPDEPQPATQVNVGDPLELQLWALRFDATAAQVRRAVAAAGTRVAAVAAWIDAHRADDLELLALRG